MAGTLWAQLRQQEGWEDLQDFIVSKGSLSPEDNLRIYREWFSTGPRYLFRAVAKKYNLTDHILCDAGCKYGTNLLYCSPGSYGIEIDPEAARFAQGLGLTVYQRDLGESDLRDLPLVDAVWNSAVLEHMDSPHILLRKLHGILKPGGLLALYVPTIPTLQWIGHLPAVGKYFRGYASHAHVNAFTPATLRFFCERAGFKTLEVSPFLPRPLSVFNRAAAIVGLLDGCVYIGSKIEGWDYGWKAERRVASNERGFERKPGV